MSDETKTSLMKAAEAFIATGNAVNKQLLADMPGFLKDLVTIDYNKDGVISGKEFASGMMNLEHLDLQFKPDVLRKAGCTPEVRKEIAQMIPIYSARMTRRLHVLNNPQDTLFGLDTITRQMMNTFYLREGLKPENVTPEVANYLSSEIKTTLGEFNKSMVQIHQGMVSKGEIGTLPKQVLPVEVQDFCDAIPQRMI